MAIAGRAIAGSLALLGVGVGIVIALRPAPAALEPTAVGAPSPIRQVPASQASAMGTMAPPTTMAPFGSTTPTQPKPVEVAKTLEQALQIARSQPQPPPSPAIAIAKAKSLHEAIEAVLAADREAKGEPPPGTAGINPFATAAGK